MQLWGSSAMYSHTPALVGAGVSRLLQFPTHLRMYWLVSVYMCVSSLVVVHTGVHSLACYCCVSLFVFVFRERERERERES